MITLELTRKEYDELQVLIFTAKNYCTQEANQCAKILEDLPDCKLEGVVEYWKDLINSAEEISDKLSDQRRKQQ